MPAYDYLVVGAGSAGCVLAARLSEDPATRVLLLEAGGGDELDDVRIPAAFSRLFKTARDWDYQTVPQAALGGRSVYWPRGKLLGGSSAMNAMIYIRGNPLDYDRWRDEFDCPGWGFADLLPYFRRAEDNARGADQWHATGGPLRVEDLRHVHPLSRAFVAAAVEWGLPANPDFNGAAQDGVGCYQVTQRRGRRWSAADAYLRPALGRPNLTVHTGALVTRLVVEGGRAVGVAYRRRGADVVAHAEAEVLLAAGAVNSPQLLLLSGIGPADQLREHGLPVLVDAPAVGENLQDHPVVPVLHFTHGVGDLYDGERPGQLARWLLTRRGPLASNVGEVGGFLRTDPALPAPDLQLHVAPAAYLGHGLAEPIGRGLTIGPTLVSVRSRGRLRLASADPRWRPLIDPGYLTDEADLTPLVAGIRIVREIAARRPLARLLYAEHLPGVEVVTNEELRAYVRREAETLYHPVGTAAMGGAESAVVDPALRVRGVAGLRVVDAAVFPTVPRGNTNAPVIAVAERAADLIRGRLPATGAPVR